MLKRLYLWTLEKAAHPLAERWLALIAFLESSVFPIPPDVMLAPMCLARPARAFRLALIATFTSVVGAAAGWLIGAGFFDAIGRPVLALYGAESAFADLALEFNERGLWI
ncbi:MAG: DedA family protein, partial [Pseudomonadota bacterium]